MVRFKKGDDKMSTGLPQTEKLFEILEKAELLSARSGFLNSDNLFRLLRSGFVNLTRESKGNLYLTDEYENIVSIGITGQPSDSKNFIKLTAIESPNDIELTVSVRNQSNRKMQSKYSIENDKAYDCLVLKAQGEDQFNLENTELDQFIIENISYAFLTNINASN